MPNIPVVTAQGARAIPSTPGQIHIPETNLAGANQAAHALREAADTTAGYIGNLRTLQLNTDFLSQRTEYNAQLDVLRQDLPTDHTIITDPKDPKQDFLANYMGAFEEKEKLIRENILAKSKNSNANILFNNYIQQKLPSEIVKAKADGMKLWVNLSLGKLDIQHEDLSNEAARADDPKTRDGLITNYQILVENAIAAGVVHPDQGAKRMIAFRKDTNTKYMKNIASRGDIGDLVTRQLAGEFSLVEPDVQAKTLEGAIRVQEHKDNQVKKARVEAEQLYEDHIAALANFGNWRETDAQAAMAGQNPFISPDKARVLYKINENPPTGGGALAVRVILQNFESGDPTLERVRKARAELNQLSNDLGAGNPHVVKALEHINSKWFSARGVVAQERQALIKQAEDDYVAQSGAHMPGMLGTMQRNQEKTDLAEMRNRIRGGADPVGIVKELINKQKGVQEGKPEPQKKIDGILKQTPRAVPETPVNPENRIDDILRNR